MPDSSARLFKAALILLSHCGANQERTIGSHTSGGDLAGDLLVVAGLSDLEGLRPSEQGWEGEEVLLSVLVGSGARNA